MPVRGEPRRTATRLWKWSIEYERMESESVVWMDQQQTDQEPTASIAERPQTKTRQVPVGTFTKKAHKHAKPQHSQQEAEHADTANAKALTHNATKALT